MLTRKNGVGKKTGQSLLGWCRSRKREDPQIQKRIKFDVDPKEQKPSTAEKKLANPSIQDHSEET